MSTDRMRGGNVDGTLLSVIVPVYNVEPYLRQCLDSVCGQTYRTLEILCVDDGSTDGSLDILREYEAKDPRVRVFCQPNAGLAAARNTGLDAATGEWVTGLDPDDWLEPHAYETAMQGAVEGVDLVCFGTHVVAEDGMERYAPVVRQRLVVPFSGFRRMEDEVLNKMDCCVWNKLYRRSSIKTSAARFEDDGDEGEDLGFNACFNVCARAAAFIDEPLYCLRLRKVSHRPAYGEDRCRNQLLCMAKWLGRYREQGLVGRYSSYLGHLLAQVFAALIRDGAGDGSQKKWVDVFEAQAKACLAEEGAELAALLPRQIPQLGWLRQAERLAGTATVEGFETLNKAVHVAILVEDECELIASIATLESLRRMAVSRNVCVHVVAGQVPQASLSRLRRFASTGFAVRLYRPDADQLRLFPFYESRVSCGDVLRASVPLLLRDVDKVILLPAGSVVSEDFNSFREAQNDSTLAAVLPVSAPVSENEEPSGLGLPRRRANALLLNLRGMREAGKADAWLGCLFLRDHRESLDSTAALRAAFPSAVCELRAEDRAPLHSPLKGLGRCELERLDLVLRREELRRKLLRCRLMSHLTWGRRKRDYEREKRECRALLRSIEEIEQAVAFAHCLPSEEDRTSFIEPQLSILSPLPEPPDGRKTIAFVYAIPFEPQSGGIQRVTDELCKHLCKTYRVLYFCLKPPAGTYAFPVSLFLPNGRSEQEKIRSYHAFLKEQKVDVIINQGGQFLSSRFFLETGDTKVKKVSVLHNVPMREYANLGWQMAASGDLLEDLDPEKREQTIHREKEKLKDYWKEHYRYIQEHTDALCLLSSRYREELAEVSPDLALLSFAIPNPNTYEPAPVIDWHGKEREIIFVGRLEERQKQVSLLLDVWRLVQESHPEWRLTIVGDGSDREALEARAGVLDRCTFVGRQDPEPYYRRASILCMTSLFEGWGMVLTEAQQFGVVPIAFESYAAARDIIELGVSGELVTPFSVEEYAQKLSHLMEDDEYRNLLARQAAQSVQRFSNEKVVEQWRNLIDSL